MIQFIEQIIAGNALKLYLAPPPDARYWRVLRKTSNDIAGPDDAAAVRVFEGDDEAVVDADGLINGTSYYYQVFYRVGDAWQPSDVQVGVPTASYNDESVDVLVLLRDRLEAGVAVEVQRGMLNPRPKPGGQPRIEVLTAPPVYEETAWPVVTVHLDRNAPAEYFLGDEIAPDEAVEDGVESYTGALDRWELTIVGWTLNPDERIRLRQALHRIVLANKEVFAGYGLREIQCDLRDSEDMERYGAPVYQVMGSFSCLAPAYISAVTGAIADTTVTVNGDDGNG
ncbi:MAG TPA: hypothetical protein VFL54_09985 [Gammaproteobacteria bacterium]|nr:hypothetical protein [Gammaproteobacteria bacterium]